MTRTNPKHRRLALITLCVVATLSYAAVLVSAQLREQHTGGVSGSAYSTVWSSFGWPTVYRERSTTYALPWFRVDESVDTWSFSHLSINSVVILALASCVGAVTWRVIRFFRHERTVSIAFLLALVASSGVVFPLNNGLDVLADLQLNKTDWPSPHEMPSLLRVTVWFGLFCFAYTATVSVWHCAQTVLTSRKHNRVAGSV